MTNKEFYEECLHHICNLFDIVLAHTKIGDVISGDWYKMHWETSFYYEIDEFELLIKKHFDNPPLKFEELEPDMVVWDNRDKSYIHIKYYILDGKWEYEVFGWEGSFTFKFEENRYYRKEVKDE